MATKRWMNPLTVVLVLSGVFFLIFLAVSGLIFLTKGSEVVSGESGSSYSFLKSTGSVGVIEVKGVILESEKVLERLERAERSPQVKAVVLRLNSPGGATAPSQEIYEAVKKMKKPVLASMGSVAASGAYYIAAGCSQIFANPGTLTGSIGVVMQFANLEGLYDWAKVKRYAIKTGKFKDIGAEYRTMGAEERALLQALVEDVLVQFKEAVVSGRKLTAEQVDAIADGRIFSEHQAKELGLVDTLGTLTDAVAEAGRLGGIEGKPRVIRLDKEKKRLLDYFMDDSWDSQESSSRVAGVIHAAGVFGQMMRFLLGGSGAQGVLPALTSSGQPGWTSGHSHSLGVGGVLSGAQTLLPQPGIYWVWGSGVPSVEGSE